MARNTRRVPAVNPTEELIQLAIDLDLTTLAQSLPTLLESAEKDSPSFTDFGLKMFRAEVIARKTRRLERSLKRSRLGVVEGLEGFDFAARPKLDPRQGHRSRRLSCRLLGSLRTRCGHDRRASRIPRRRNIQTRIQAVCETCSIARG